MPGIFRGALKNVVGVSRLMKTIVSIFRKFRSSPLIRDDSGIALVAIVFVLGAAALTSTTMVLRQNSGVQAELEQIQRKNADLDKIRDAILVTAYQDTNIQLPCPADPDGGNLGTEDRAGTTCNTLRGVVPWQTIGLAPQDVQGQQGLVTYVVHQSETDVCNTTVGRAGTMDNLGTAATDSINFALIDHGDNGLGAVNADGTFRTAPTSTEELANCAVGSVNDPCNVTNLGEIRTGPPSEDSASEFDDIVLAVDISVDDFVDTMCLDIAEEDGDISDGGSGGEAGQTAQGAEFGFGDRQITQLLNRSANDTSGEQTRSIVTGDDDTNPDGEVLDGVRFRNDGTNDTRSCAWTEIAFPIDSDMTGEVDPHSIRMFLQFGSETDPSGVRGDGAVIAIAQTNLEGAGAYELDGTYCGSPGGENLGFQEVASGLTLFPISPFPRFGIEIDTEDHRGVGSNFDNLDNHISIVGMDVNHAGLDITETDTTLVGSAVCDEEADLDTANNDGDYRLDAITGGFIAGSVGDPEGATVTACYVNTDGNDVNTMPLVHEPDTNENAWLEQDDDAIANFHNMRIEIDNRGDSECADIGNELHVQYWVWPTDSTFGLNCPSAEHTSLCSNLTDSYENLQTAAGVAQMDTPTGSQCIPWSSSENLVQIGLVSGADGGGTQDQFTIRTFSIATDRDFAAPAEVVDQASETFEINAPRLVLELVADGYLDAATAQTRAFSDQFGLYPEFVK